MAYLQEHPTLRDLQKYIDDVCQERGWVKDTYSEKFLLFIEEVGELAKAIRQVKGLYGEKAKQNKVSLPREGAGQPGQNMGVGRSWLPSCFTREHHSLRSLISWIE